jgi:hypothetical protein
MARSSSESLRRRPAQGPLHPGGAGRQAPRREPGHLLRLLPGGEVAQPQRSLTYRSLLSLWTQEALGRLLVAPPSTCEIGHMIWHTLEILIWLGLLVLVMRLFVLV